MKLKEIVSLLANRINQPHVIEKYLRIVGYGAYEKGAEDVIVALPTKLREMANELNEKQVNDFFETSEEYWESIDDYNSLERVADFLENRHNR